MLHDMNAFYGHESPENYLFLLAHLGAQCPMCTVKKVIWNFRLPVTKDETNIQCMLEIKCGSDLIIHMCVLLGALALKDVLSS